MKKLAVTLSLLAIAAGAFAQGSVNPNNGLNTQFRTNSTGIGGGAGLALSASGGPYFYEVLTAPSSVTTVDSSLQGLLSGPWSDTGLLATNTATAGREAGPQGVNFWAVGATNSFIVVGWSANEGSTWAAISAKLSGATLQGGVWTGGTLVNGGFVGATVVSFRQAGGVIGSTTIPTPALFGTSGADTQGQPIGTQTDLFVVAPEPTSFALAGLGAAALMIFRRRK